MSDPARDAAARKAAEKREKIRDEYTPIVVWVKVPGGRSASRVRNWLREQVNNLPYLHAAGHDAPYCYATEGTIREDEADGSSIASKSGGPE